MFIMNYVSFYLLGWVGVGMMLASSFSMVMRLWDGVTDPFVGFMVDKTNGKFGKNRPFMVIGNLILAVTSFILFHVTHLLPQVARLPFFIVISAIYYLGYTAQCVVTKSAQSCLTNDPKQRPLFAAFDGVYNTILFAGIAIVAANIAVKFENVDPTGQGGYGAAEWFHAMWLFTAIVSGICTTIAVFSIAPKDRVEFFGTGKPVKVGLKDYWEVLKNNCAIQMLVISASSDKLASTSKTSDPAKGTIAFGFFTIAYLILTVAAAGFQGISGNIVIPMTADCADYEVYRSGKYVPGLMGTLFSFVDKIISSFAPMIAGLMFTICGFSDRNPATPDDYSFKLRVGVIAVAYGMLILGLICNVIALKFYPLTKEKMEEIRVEVDRIKREAAQEA
ncbi:MAG: MFS transporter [Oscillospiraceae bacterium]|nr:MFS transporter [Oscillospiraceae bacterium]